MLKNSTWKKWYGLCLLSIVILSLQTFMAAGADQNKPQPSEVAKNHAKQLLDYQKLQAPPSDFPSLPIFPGKTKFLNGYYLPSKNGASVCQMSYLAKEDTKAVLDFYTNAFSGNGWNIQFAAGPAISARHTDGHLCSVTVMESKMPKMKSQFTIAYRQLIK